MKTKVWKDRYQKGYWTVTYELPYSGILSAQFTNWEEAVEEAYRIEHWRVFL